LGNLTPPLGNVDVQLTFVRPNGVTSETRKVPLTQGVFKKTTQELGFKFEEAGNWTIIVDWPGDLRHEGAMTKVELMVSRIPTSLSLNVEKPSINLGDPILVKGAINPKINASIWLLYFRPDGTNITFTVTTNPEWGNFSFDGYKPDKAGKWSVLAVWGEGSQVFENTRSLNVEFTVTAPPPSIPVTMIIVFTAIPTAVGGIGYIIWRHFAHKGEKPPKPPLKMPPTPTKPPKPLKEVETRSKLEELEKLYRAGKINEAAYKRLKERYMEEAEG